MIEKYFRYIIIILALVCALVVYLDVRSNIKSVARDEARKEIINEKNQQLKNDRTISSYNTEEAAKTDK